MVVDMSRPYGRCKCCPTSPAQPYVPVDGFQARSERDPSAVRDSLMARARQPVVPGSPVDLPIGEVREAYAHLHARADAWTLPLLPSANCPPCGVRRVGVTATRVGLTAAQKNTGRKLFGDIQKLGQPYIELHHGDCVGGDKEVFEFATVLEYRTVAHPPTSPALRAFTESDLILPGKPYLLRNKDIVDVSCVLVAFPKGEDEEQRSGTWHTVRYARSVGRRLVIVWPNGQQTGGSS